MNIKIFFFIRSMKIVYCSIIFIIFFSCEVTDYQIKNVEPKELNSNLSKDITILDVRTPEEFKTGHIEGAININFYSKFFNKAVNKIDRKSSLYVYCKSGSRSEGAVKVLKRLGFKNIFNLKGGIQSWQSKGYNISTFTLKKKKPSVDLSNVLKEITQNKSVLISFNATWCKPCLIMKPVIESIKKEYSNIKVISVDIDADKNIMNHYKVNNIPTFIGFYKSKEHFRHSGIIEKNDLIELLKFR